MSKSKRKPASASKQKKQPEQKIPKPKQKKKTSSSASSVVTSEAGKSTATAEESSKIIESASSADGQHFGAELPSYQLDRECFLPQKLKLCWFRISKPYTGRPPNAECMANFEKWAKAMLPRGNKTYSTDYADKYSKVKSDAQDFFAEKFAPWANAVVDQFGLDRFPTDCMVPPTRIPKDQVFSNSSRANLFTGKHSTKDAGLVIIYWAAAALDPQRYQRETSHQSLFVMWVENLIVHKGIKSYESKDDKVGKIFNEIFLLSEPWNWIEDAISHLGLPIEQVVVVNDGDGPIPPDKFRLDGKIVRLNAQALALLSYTFKQRKWLAHIVDFGLSELNDNNSDQLDMRSDCGRVTKAFKKAGIPYRLRYKGGPTAKFQQQVWLEMFDSSSES